jgi:hypothetical protein
MVGRGRRANDRLIRLGVADVSRARRVQPGQLAHFGLAALAVERALRPHHQDLVDPRSMPFDPLFHRARPGRGRGGGLAITPVHQSLTRYCFAPDHAPAHLKAQAVLPGRATNCRGRLEITMKTLLSIAAIAALMLGGAEASIAAKLPTFERDGFPITPHQLQVLGPYGVQEQAPTLSFTRDGMPVTPHQVRVLRRDNPPTY